MARWVYGRVRFDWTGSNEMDDLCGCFCAGMPVEVPFYRHREPHFNIYSCTIHLWSGMTSKIAGQICLFHNCDYLFGFGTVWYSVFSIGWASYGIRMPTWIRNHSFLCARSCTSCVCTVHERTIRVNFIINWEDWNCLYITSSSFIITHYY